MNDPNTLLAIGVATVLIIGGLVYYFTSNSQSDNSKPLNQEDLDELTKDSDDPKREKKKAKKRNLTSLEKDENENEKKEIENKEVITTVKKKKNKKKKSGKKDNENKEEIKNDEKEEEKEDDEGEWIKVTKNKPRKDYTKEKERTKLEHDEFLDQF
jgi:hypothetical protein